MSQPVKQALRAGRKTRTGMVVSDRMKKTIVVRVDRLARHPVFSRVIKRAKTFKVHDESNSAHIGDWVTIMETRPLSKDKRWRLVEIIRRASTAPTVPGREEPQRQPTTRAKATGTAEEAVGG